MRISEQWLREWANPRLTLAELTQQLTMTGLEVEGVEPAAPEFSGVVVGLVTALAPHPEAERLRVATVDIGRGESLRIVCGAPNAKVGMRAPVALPGASLLGAVKIATTTLRGVQSQGMLCSAKELGLGEDGDGLLELPSTMTVGDDLRAALALDDQVFTVSPTPNRGDCLSIAGVAREVSVIGNCPLTPVATDPVTPLSAAQLEVTLADPADCPRYVGCVIRDLDPTAQTPLWLRERLRRAGLRSLGPLVDVTNYVMLELGQPLHAFDLDKLEGGITVRRAREGEILVLLNDQRIALAPDTLLITDASGPVALAGIMGGAATAVGDNTRHVFLESAFFTPTSIAGRARRYGLQTDASQRFERGVDPALQARAAERATRLLMGIAGGKPGPLVDVRADRHLPTPVAITLRAHRISRLLGMDIEPVQVVDILQRLGMNVTAIAGGWRVTPPSFRFDISLEADLIEEIARIHGYDRVPDHQPSAQLPMPRCAEGIISRARMRDTLVQRGYQEAITFSFVDPDLQRRFDPTPAIALVNPIAADLAVLRTSLWPGLVKALLHNQKRQQERVRLFEVGRVFRGDVEALQQDHMIGAIASRDALPRQWGAAKRSVDFFDVKGDLEALLALTGEPEAFTFAAASHPALHPGQTARILRNDIPVGWLGALHPALGLALEIEDKAFVFELAVAELNPALVPQFRELSRFPASRRDLAVVVDEAVSAEQLRKCIAHSGGKQLRDVTIFDYYRGLGVPAGQKSLAFSLIFQDFTSNLTDSAVEDAMALIRAELHEQFGATPRA